MQRGTRLMTRSRIGSISRKNDRRKKSNKGILVYLPCLHRPDTTVIALCTIIYNIYRHSEKLAEFQYDIDYVDDTQRLSHAVTYKQAKDGCVYGGRLERCHKDLSRNRPAPRTPWSIRRCYYLGTPYPCSINVCSYTCLGPTLRPKVCSRHQNLFPSLGSRFPVRRKPRWESCSLLPALDIVQVWIGDFLG